MKTLSLSQGFEALVDDSDFPAVSQFKWSAQRKRNGVYAVRNVKIDGRWRLVQLHSFLLPGALRIDHVNGNPLDNRRGNLRPATPGQNSSAFQKKRSCGRSAYRGVALHRNKWTAQIQVQNEHFYLGIFSTEEEAARAYDSAARKFFKEFASPNFP